MLVEPVMWFDLVLIPTPSRQCPRRRSPITSVSLISAGLMLPTVHVKGAATKRPACLLHATWHVSCLHTQVTVTMLFEPWMWFDFKLIPNTCSVWPFPLGPSWCRHPHVPHEPWHGNQFDLCWSDAFDCPRERCGHETARMLAACSLARILLA